MRLVGKIIFVFLLVQMLTIRGGRSRVLRWAKIQIRHFLFVVLLHLCKKRYHFANGTVPAINCAATKTFDTEIPIGINSPVTHRVHLDLPLHHLNTIPEDYDWQLFDITGHDPLEVLPTVTDSKR
jgi:hypothetical protein